MPTIDGAFEVNLTPQPADTRDGADNVSEYRLLDREPHVDGEGP